MAQYYLEFSFISQEKAIMTQSVINHCLGFDRDGFINPKIQVIIEDNINLFREWERQLAQGDSLKFISEEQYLVFDRAMEEAILFDEKKVQGNFKKVLEDIRSRLFQANNVEKRRYG